MAQNYGEILKYTAILGAGFVAVKLALYVKDEMGKGAKAAAAVAAAAKEVLTKDLNPASNENVVYKGLNSVTGGNNSSDSIGTRLYAFLNPEPAQIQQQAQEDFRAGELATVNDVAPSTGDAQSDFRAGEINLQNGGGISPTPDPVVTAGGLFNYAMSQ